MSNPTARRETASLGPSEGLGTVLVLASAIFWSFGGALARFLPDLDGWTVIFWRSVFASLFLFGFMLLRDGMKGTLTLFRAMGLAGVAVGICFTIASTAFIIALAYTTVANVVLMLGSVPLIAALMCRLLFREDISGHTWVAIAAVILGVGIMVSDSLSGQVSPVGDALALLIAFAFASATVITRRHSGVRMTPAVLFGTITAGFVAFFLAPDLAITQRDALVLFTFGAVSFGGGLALFVTGARLIPSALAALLGMAETVLGPVWAALIHGEVPATRTIIGGTVVLAALLANLGLETWRQRHRRVMS